MNSLPLHSCCISSSTLVQHYICAGEVPDFIINYDIKYRMGGDLDGDEGDEDS